GPSLSSASRAGMIASRLAWTRRRFSASRAWPPASAWAMRRRLAVAWRRWICRNTGGVWKAGQGRQALGGGQSCWGGGAAGAGGAGAVAVGQAVADPVEVVLDPLGRSGGGAGVVADPLPGDVDPLGLVAVECLPDGGVMDLRVMAGHAGAGMPEELL